MAASWYLAHFSVGLAARGGGMFIGPARVTCLFLNQWQGQKCGALIGQDPLPIKVPKGNRESLTSRVVPRSPLSDPLPPCLLAVSVFRKLRIGTFK